MSTASTRDSKPLGRGSNPWRVANLGKVMNIFLVVVFVVAYEGTPFYRELAVYPQTYESTTICELVRENPPVDVATWMYTKMKSYNGGGLRTIPSLTSSICTDRDLEDQKIDL